MDQVRGRVGGTVCRGNGKWKLVVNRDTNGSGDGDNRLLGAPTYMDHGTSRSDFNFYRDKLYRYRYKHGFQVDTRTKRQTLGHGL